MIPGASDLSYFVEVSNSQNLSRSAERLGISQPSLTLAIQRLEQSIRNPSSNSEQERGYADARRKTTPRSCTRTLTEMGNGKKPCSCFDPRSSRMLHHWLPCFCRNLLVSWFSARLDRKTSTP